MLNFAKGMRYIRKKKGDRFRQCYVKGIVMMERGRVAVIRGG